MPDLAFRPYEFELRGRRPASWLFGAVGAFFLALVAFEPPPLLIWVPLGLFLVMTAWLLIRNPVTGMRLSVEGWEFRGARFDRTVPLAAIDHVSIREWSDGPDTVRIHLRTGEVLEPPSVCLPTGEVLRAELARARIPVRD